MCTKIYSSYVYVPVAFTRIITEQWRPLRFLLATRGMCKTRARARVVLTFFFASVRRENGTAHPTRRPRIALQSNRCTDSRLPTRVCLCFLSAVKTDGSCLYTYNRKLTNPACFVRKKTNKNNLRLYENVSIPSPNNNTIYHISTYARFIKNAACTYIHTHP